MKRLSVVSMAAVLIATSLTACSSGNTIVPNSHLTVGEVGAVETFNSDVAVASGTKAASDLSQLTTQNFFDVDKNGNLVANKSFGTVEIVKQDPFTVTYTLGKSAVWSDGSNLDATDLTLAVEAAKDPDFNSIHHTSSLALAEIVGTPKIGQKSISLKFPNPIADWRTVLDVAVPAHVVGKFAGIGGNVSAVRAGVIDAIAGNKTEVLAKLATAYSDAFKPTADLENFITDGAYTVKSVSEKQVVLKAVRDYFGSHSAIAETVNMAFFATNADAFKSVNSGDVDVFAPQVTLNEPQSDLVAQSQSVSSKVATVLAPGSNLVEQFVVNLGRGALSDATYSDPKTAQVLRKAFLNLVPKSRAVDFASLTQTVNKADSFVFASGSKNYSAVISSNGSSDYLIQDVEKASEMIASLKLATPPVVRVLFDSDNPAAVAEWTLLSDQASTAGFKLKNVSSPDPTAALAGGTYEVYLGALPLIGVGTGSVETLLTGPAQMPEEQEIALTAKVIGATDKGSAAALQDLDKQLFELGYGLPMYQLPTLLLYNNRISGFTADPFGTNSTWGYWNWHVSADKS